MQGLPSSTRARRRALIGACVVLALAVLVPLGIKYSNTGKVQTTSVSDRQAQFTPEQKQVPLTRATKREVTGTLRRFVGTAVVRQNVADAYDLVTPKLREGMSRREWATSDIPVYPYPASVDRIEISRFVGSFANDVLLDILLQPRRGADVGPVAFDVELKARGSGAARRWQVDSFVPRAAFPAAGAPKSAKPKALKPKQAPAVPKTKVTTTAAKPAAGDSGYGAGHLSARWFLLPAVFLALIVLIPLALVVRTWRTNRRIAREYEAQRSLPPLPKR